MGAKSLSDERVRELRTRRVINGENLAKLAREFGISRDHAYRVVIGDYRVSAGGPLYEPHSAPRPGAVATELNAEDRALARSLVADGAKPQNVAAAMMCTPEQLAQALEEQA